MRMAHQKKALIGLLVFTGVIITAFTYISGNFKYREEITIASNPLQDIRKAQFAGSWYPGTEKELRVRINNLIGRAKRTDIHGEIIALVSPHAGYDYSGFTAANSYKQIMGEQYEAVIVIATSHREWFNWGSVYPGDGFKTPLGVVPVHKSLAKAIVAEDELMRFSMEGHRAEHSLEIQLPFLQVAIQDLKIVPICVGQYSLNTCKRLASAITNAVKGRKILIVASTDLYHGESEKECVRTNDRTIEKILELHPEELCDGLIDQTYQACGGGPVVVAEMVAINLGANKAKLLHRTNSGKVTGQKGGYVVGYCAVAIYKEDKVEN